jgi:hypothetical protein
MAKKKSKKKTHRKNPKRVAAGKKAARARWGKGHSKKASKKTGKRRVNIDRVEKAVEKVLSKHYTIALDGSRHSISFPGHGHGGAKKAGKRKSRKPASPAQLLARARFTAMVKARAAARRAGGVRVRKVTVPKFKHGTEPRFIPYGFSGE